MTEPNNPPRLNVLRLPGESSWPVLLRRAGLAVGLICAVAVLLWFDRDGLRDNAHPERPIRFSDVFYFTVVSLTTVGYGDIAPVTEGARLVNAILLTPIRIFLWALFLGTAYELSVLRVRFREERQMRQLRERLRDHVIVCGFGVVGRSVVAELLAHGHPREGIVVIDPAEEALAEAGERELIAIRGDASSEAMLRAAAIETASYVLVAPHRDDACVLIALTVRTLNPTVQLVVAAREEENVKLLYRAGANLVVAPSVSGGRLMATAVRQEAVPRVLEDLLSFGAGLDVGEHVVRADEAGKRVQQLPDLAGKLVLEVARGDRRVPFSACGDLPLAAGDVVVFLAAGQPAGATTRTS